MLCTSLDCLLIASGDRRGTYLFGPLFPLSDPEMMPVQTRPTLEFRPVSLSSSRAVTRTLRIDSDVESRIEQLAEKEGVSFNLLANRSLRKLVEWEATAEKFGFAQVPIHALEQVFNLLTEQQSRELGREAGKNMMQEMILFWFKRLDRDTALNLLAMSAKYAKLFKLERITEGRTDTVVLKHDRGPNASAYYSELLKSLFQSLNVDVKTQETDGQVVAMIAEPSITARPARENNMVSRRAGPPRLPETPLLVTP
jgi:hypothetical protein